jgi:hypothetical protein
MAFLECNLLSKTRTVRVLECNLLSKTRTVRVLECNLLSKTRTVRVLVRKADQGDTGSVLSQHKFPGEGTHELALCLVLVFPGAVVRDLAGFYIRIVSLEDGI